MLTEERRNQILAQAYTEGFVRTSALVQQFDVSEVTLRSDLQELERRGRLTRTRGGAMTTHSDPGKTTFDSRLIRNKAEKQRIALAASELLSGNQTVIFDAGTTVLALAHHMPPVTGLTVLTPGLNIAQHLLRTEGVDVVMIGGPVDPDTLSTHWPVSMPGEGALTAHTAFVGSHSIDADLDLVDVSLEAAASKRRLVNAGRRVVLLVDSSKWGGHAAAKIVGLSAIDVVITDKALADGLAREIRNAGPELILV